MSRKRSVDGGDHAVRKKQKRRTCAHEGCFTLPVYNMPDQKQGLVCASHTQSGMIDVTSPKCLHPGCLTRPSFNTRDQRCGVYCFHHKRDGMINVQKRRCAHSGCTTTATFNTPDAAGGKWCSVHSTPGMINTVRRKCAHPSCVLAPSFNTHGSKRGLWCKRHAPDGTVNVTSRMCESVGCCISPSFAWPGDTNGRYCKRHAKTGMLEVVTRKCSHIGCLTQPSYAEPGQKRAVYCRKHAMDHMVNVFNKRCDHPQCNTSAWFGSPGYAPTRCAPHREPGMIQHPRRRCQDCKSPALFGITRPTHCETHHAPEMQCFLQTRCAKCQLIDIVDPTDQMCGACSAFFTRRCYLRKQRYVKRWLESSTLPPITTYDRPIEDGKCGKERPDFHWETPTHHVFLEVDEDQHRNRDPTCEEVRMKNITYVGGMAAVWIRYNPDAYVPGGAGDKPHKGDQLKEKDKERMLCHTLERALQMVPTGPEEMCRVAYLCYDGYRRSEPVAFRTLSLV